MNPKKILVIQTAFIGDVILSTGFLREVKRVFPKAKIDLITTPVSAPLFQYNPHLDNIISFHKKGIKGIIEFKKLIRKLIAVKYDAAFSLHLSTRSSLIMKKAKIPIRIGNPRMKYLTHPISVPKKLHIKDRYIGLLKPFTNIELNSETELHFSENIFNKTKEFIGDDRKFKIGIAPGSIRNTKKWPKEYFSEIVHSLQYKDVSIFLIGGNDDKVLGDEIINNCKNTINLCGELSLLESACLIKKMDLMLSNDSAPLHMANAVKTDVISFFGPTVKAFGCYPYRDNDTILEVELSCRPCSKHGGESCPKSHFKCMKEIKPNMVLEVIERYLQR